MSNNDDQVSVKISADAATVKEGMGQAADATKQALESMTTAMNSMTANMEKQTKAVIDALGGVQKQVKKTGDETKSSIDMMLSTLNGFAKTAQGHLAHVAEAFEKVKGSLMAFAAVAAGGAALKAVINDTNAWNLEALKLAKQLGITTEQASVYMVATHKLGIEADVLGTATQKVAMQLMKGGQGFEEMGIKVKDASGAFRPAVEIITETNDKIKAIHNPILQAQAGLSAYGKAWGDIKPLLKLTSEQMDEAAAKAKQLGLIVGGDAAAASKEYKENVREIGLAVEALEINLGNALLPVFKNLTGAMAEVAGIVIEVLKPAFDLLGTVASVAADILASFAHLIEGVLEGAVETFGEVVGAVFGEDIPKHINVVQGALNGLKTFLQLFKLGATEVFEYLALAAEQMQRVWVTLAQVAEKALHLDWSGAKAAFNAGVKDLEDIANKHMTKMAKMAEEANKAIADIWSGNGAKSGKASKPEHEDPNYDFSKGQKDKRDPGRTSQWEAQLAAKKDALEKQAAMDGNFREMSKQEEADYWASILTKSDLTLNEKLAAQKKYYALEAQVRKDAFATEIETLNASKEAMGKNYEARIAVAQKVYDEVAAAYGKESKEAAKAYGEILKERKALADQVAKIAQLQAEAEAKARVIHVEAEYKAAQAELELIGASDAQKLALERDYLDRKHEMQIQALQYRLIDPSMDPEEYARIKAQMKDIDAQYAAQKQQLDSKNQAAGLAPLMNVMNSAQQSFASALDGMMQHTKTFQQGMATIWKGITSAITGEISKIIAQKVMMFAKDKIFALAGIQTDAVKAGAGAASSQAAIPIVGPGMALASMAATMAAVMGLTASLPSAANGFDIPAGVNPLTQLHEKEMVLPAEHAETIRNMGGGGMGGDTHFHINALHPRDFESFLRRGGSDVMVKALSERHRNGGL